MKCISLWQPWASLCFLGKPDETRHWATNHRGLLLIHAAMKWDSELAEMCGEWPFAQTLPLLKLRLPDDVKARKVVFAAAEGTYTEMILPVGCILGVVELVACRPTREVREIRTPLALAFGDYSDGRFAWEFREPRVFRAPIPYRGQQGLFDVPYDPLLREAMEALAP